jgi:TolB-like protein/DNA-binding winged helix-turn-helix (wHTH) protein/Tfp pilus assembly protein PilF
MQGAASSNQSIRFGAFEFDLATGELRKRGLRIRLRPQMASVLRVLVENPDRLIAREEFQEKVWPESKFGDFDHSLHNVITRLREALGDSAELPRYIETLPRRGYRFIGHLEPVSSPSPKAAAHPSEALGPSTSRYTRRQIALAVLALLVVAVGSTVWIYARAPYKFSVPQITSIAVLPLEDLSADRSQEYFADGITDELITALAKINSLRVISRTTVMQYKKVRRTLPEVARDLGVEGVVEGTVARSGNTVRVTAQLIYAPADRHIWAERYERRSQEILLLENELAKAIAEQIRGSLTPQEQRLFIAHPVEAAAHEAYLQGRYLWNKRTVPAIEESTRYFQEAIQKDPSYAQAYAGLADSYAVLGSWALEAMPPQQASSKARSAAIRALQLDNTSAEAHTALATISHIYDRDWPAAQREFHHALELNPSYSTAHQWYSQYLCHLGRFDECIVEAEKAHGLDPSNLVAAAHVGLCLYWAQRHREAITPIRKLLEFEPDFRLGRRFLGQAYEQDQNYSQAVTELRRAAELSQTAPVDLAALGHAYAVSGQRAEALAVLQKFEQLAKKSYVSNYDTALVTLGLGQTDRALELLDSAIQEQSTWIAHLKVDPRLDPLRSNPRFTALLSRAGFAP